MKKLLKEKPLRYAGQSLDEKIENVISEKIMPDITVGLVLVILASYEWIRKIFNPQPHPFFVTLVTVFGIFVIVYRVWKNKKKLNDLRLGRDGERIVGQHLEELRASGAIIFHDIVADQFNIDHIVVAPQGVFTIETKTWNKKSPDEKINFNGDSIMVNGYRPNRNPVQQALTQASYMQKLLEGEIGKNIFVWPVIVFPEWFIEPEVTTRAKEHGFWLLNPKALPRFIANKEKVLSEEDIKLIAYHLSRCAQRLTTTNH